MRSIKLPALLLCFATAAACGKKEEDPPAPEPKPAVSDAAAPAPARTAVDHYLAYVAAFNERDEKALAAAFADDAELTLADSSEPMKGAEAIVASNVAFWTAMPDTRLEPQVVIHDGNKVAALLLGHGTHTGPMQTPAGELPATGAETGSFGIDLVELDATGKITRGVQFWDAQLLFAQIMRAPGARAAVRKGLGAPVVAAAEGAEHPFAVKLREILTIVEKADKTAASQAFGEGAVVWHSGAPEDAVGVEAIAGYYAGQRKAFPDMTVTIDELWGAGDYLVAVATYTGTHKGALPGLEGKPTGKPVKLTVGHMFQVDAEAGLIVRAWIVSNGVAMLEQLGLGSAGK